MKEFIKRNYLNIILLIIFFVGVSLVIYPTVSDYWNSRVQSKAISDYKNTVNNASNSDLERMKLEAVFYNQDLYNRQQNGTPISDDTVNYDDVLNINGDGIMGYIVIPTIGVELPIYHGTEDKVLQVATGHAKASSVPIGGENTHAVILGHRGLPSARLFNDLDQLEKGDYIEIHVLDEVLYYEVYDVLIVEPEELNSLRIVSGEDIVTLVTCTPYGINTHRLLIHTRRVDVKDENQLIFSEARKIDKAYVAIIMGIVLWIFAMIILLYVSSKRRIRKISREEHLRRCEILDKYQK